MKSPFEMAGAFPKFNRIFLTCSEKLPKFMKDGCHVDLIQMGFIVKYLLCHMDGVSDNNDFGNVFLLYAWLIQHLMTKSFAPVLVIKAVW